MLSVLNGHTDCVYSLLNKGANVDAKDKWGRTALHRGVSKNILIAFQKFLRISFCLKLNQAMFMFLHQIFTKQFLNNNFKLLKHNLIQETVLLEQNLKTLSKTLSRINVSFTFSQYHNCFLFFCFLFSYTFLPFTFETFHLFLFYFHRFISSLFLFFIILVF